MQCASTHALGVRTSNIHIWMMGVRLPCNDSAAFVFGGAILGGAMELSATYHIYRFRGCGHSQLYVARLCEVHILTQQRTSQNYIYTYIYILCGQILLISCENAYLMLGTSLSAHRTVNFHENSLGERAEPAHVLHFVLHIHYNGFANKCYRICSLYSIQSHTKSSSKNHIRSPRAMNITHIFALSRHHQPYLWELR